MYAVAPQSGYVHHSFVDSQYSNHNWQADVPGNGNSYGFEAQHPVQGNFSWNFGGMNQENGYSYDRHYSQPQVSEDPAYHTHQMAWSSSRSSAGRPPHVVVAFGFGGTMAVIKPSSQPFHDQQRSSSKIEVHKLQSLSNSAPGLDFHAGLQNGSKNELFKWIDERISNCAREEADSRNFEALPLLWEVLKIAFEHHGKLRSAVGTPSEGTGPEAAVGQAILTASSSGATEQHCLRQMPNSESLQATSIKVKGLLLSGKTQQALQCAQDGQSWGLALVLASQLGDKCYSDTISKMAHHQLSPGPLRTFSLLMSGQSADVFAENGNQGSGILDHWHEHLALMATNRTSGNDDAITRLGDALWGQKEQVAAAHLCYLLVDQNPEAFFSDGRIRLIGADHWKYPRTFFTPLAFKRTELYEYVKTKGNPQFTLVCFQPYKIVYATMLAEAGQTEEALRYTRAFLKALKQMNKDPGLESIAMDLESRLVQNLRDGKRTYTQFAGRILSNTFGYVMSSIPTPKITRYNSSTAIPSVEDQTSASKVPARSISEPDLSRRTDENASKPPPNGFLRRAGSSMFQRATSFVSRGKQANLEEDNMRFDGACIESTAAMNTNLGPEEHRELQEARKNSPGLYVQCSDYYSRCVNSFGRDGSQLVKSLISPQLPPIMKVSGRKPQAQRVEV
ncbi:protein transport protein SEC16A homolog [Selaginella moellendorffii]|uniref:protein transport protein SEC16A homolog n=1 Tax=Selaginella moellendorffii TaxID=88036 RepID=UPI000D1C3446|nr:protein transport protein SEC16A homolog [Selaginella moellendorffii]|eukprot:XP_024543719.1 protein transport protein SEC16A homolog [Selaginella moellendorffii]